MPQWWMPAYGSGCMQSGDLEEAGELMQNRTTFSVAPIGGAKFVYLIQHDRSGCLSHPFGFTH